MPREKFHRWILMDARARVFEIRPSDWRNCELWKRRGRRYKLLKVFVRNELEGKPGKKVPPRHIESMRKLELVDYCPESDVGHFKWYPNGMLIRDLVMDYALNNIALPWGAMKIQTPMIYRQDIPEIRKLHGEFLERDYSWKEGKLRLILRFASDPGALPFMQRVTFSHKHMPVRIYEEAVCFRKELKGELTGLMRVRHFSMTDQHAFCRDEEQAKQEYQKLSLLFARLMEEVIARGNWVLGFEIVEDFYQRYEGFLRRLVRRMGVPCLFKLMRRMTHYYAFKNEYQAITPDGDNIQISTVQWDVKNGERFNICYVDEEGRKVPVPIIIHASSFGSVERALAAMLETAAWMEMMGKAPMLPLWLSPEQVRLIPVSTKHLKRCEELAQALSDAGIRVGVDDRELTVPKRVFEAKRAWIPYIVVIGRKELLSKRLQVVVRELSSPRKEFRKVMEIGELVNEIRRKCNGMPFRPLYMPMRLSQRVAFVPWGG
jgi:threonyl-tRNA synthetase